MSRGAFGKLITVPTESIVEQQQAHLAWLAALHESTDTAQSPADSDSGGNSEHSAHGGTRAPWAWRARRPEAEQTGNLGIAQR